MFDWLFHKTELLTTFDQRLYQETTAKLAAAKIDHRVKWHSDASSGRQRGAFGSFGEDPRLSTQYYIYVKKQDLEQAQYILRKQN